MTIVRLLLPRDRADAFEGDMQEELARLASRVGPRRATLWHAREVALLVVHAMWRWLMLAVSFGAITGTVALGFWALDLEIGTYLSFPVVILALMALFRARPPQTYFLRFLTALTTFMTMTVVIYAGIRNLDSRVATIDLWGHTWRLCMMLAIGLVASACTALMSPGKSSSPYRVPFGLSILGFGAIYVTLMARGGWLALAVIATVLLATANFLRKQDTQPFARRFVVLFGVNAVMAGLTCALLFLFAHDRFAYRAWAALFQNGLLYVEIAATSLAFALLSRVSRAPRSTTGRAPDKPDLDPIPAESARRS
ncbi:MAG: hypothetical protein JJE51_00640 [Thermoanaerobaculia bacterium]|nr:hypothetical protein [Thermoanaerobaculia bacterium]